jgi:hypothetical protein
MVLGCPQGNVKKIIAAGEAVVQQTGITADGAPIFGGVYAFYSTYGLPLEIVLGLLHAKGGSTDFPELYDEMIHEGRMKPDRALRRIADALRDAVIPDVEAVVEKLKLLIDWAVAHEVSAVDARRLLGMLRGAR